MRDIINTIRFRIGGIALLRGIKNLYKWDLTHNRKYLKRVLNYYELAIGIAPYFNEETLRILNDLQPNIELLKRAVRG